VVANGVGISVAGAAVRFLHAGDSTGVFVFVGFIHGESFRVGGVL
jgi:hypothetical protein